mgnify:CR=1 FL=1
MKNYEVVFLLRPEEEQFKGALESIKAEFAKLGANVTKEEDMKERLLAYALKDMDRGHYYLFTFESDPSQIVEMEKSIKLMPQVLKHLFVVQE